MEANEAYHYEQAARARGYLSICGVDEAGAGPLAGRVYAAAVILPLGLLLPDLDDSKKLSEKRREALFEPLCAAAISFAIAWADEREVDEINILNARMLAMERAITALPIPADYALIDGNKSKGISCPNETIVQGDGKSASVAAASVLAKVARDRYMLEMAQRYPLYAFEKHKGYPTKLHYERLKEHGPSPIHRQSFLKKL